jgi:hypothetical protein
MNIDIGDYVITSDALNIILNDKMVNKKTGEPYLKAVGYYTNLDHLIISLVNRKVKAATVESIKELADEIRKINKWATETFSSVNKFRDI